MEGHCSTGQSSQRAIATMEEEEGKNKEEEEKDKLVGVILTPGDQE
jgi:hypothetical protein